RLELVETDMPAYFLDEVCLAQQIHAEGRRDDVPAIGGVGDLEAQARENPLHIGVRNWRAQQPRQPIAPQMDPHGSAWTRVAVDGRSGDLAGAHPRAQRHGTPD